MVIEGHTTIILIFPIIIVDRVYLLARPELQTFSVGLPGPPLAIASFGGGGVAPSEPPRIRKEFPETWLWETIDEERLGDLKLLCVMVLAFAWKSSI